MEGTSESFAMLPALLSMVYLLTWRCYGSVVPGDEDVVSRRNNLVGSRRSAASRALATYSRAGMTHDTWVPTPQERQAVLSAIADVCRYRGWTLLAAHFRTTHIHVVVQAEAKCERVMHDFKAYASRAVIGVKHWARHGSTLYLWTPEEVASAIKYVAECQGEPMTLHVPSMTAGVR